MTIKLNFCTCSAAKILRIIFHLAGALMYIGTFVYDQIFIDLPYLQWSENEFLKGRLKFLTLWNMLLQGLFFIICLWNDCIGTNENMPETTPCIRNFKDMLLASLAFPLAIFVSMTFWGLYFVDRELILPRLMDSYFPAWLNHMFHTNSMFFILIEMFTSFTKYPPRRQGICILMQLIMVYFAWIHILNFYNDMWVYPILEILNLPLRMVFFVVLLGFAVVSYILGEKLNSVIWSRQTKMYRNRHKHIS